MSGTFDSTSKRRSSRSGPVLTLACCVVALWSSAVLAQRTPSMVPRPPVVLNLPLPSINAIEAIRREQRTLLFKEAVEALRRNQSLADLPACPVTERASGTSVSDSSAVCLPREVATQSAAPVETTPLANAAELNAAPSSPLGNANSGRRHALLIGNNAYLKPIPNLETPIADVRRIASLLKDRFGYDVDVLTDGSRADLVASLRRLVEASADSVSTVILYAGHGYLVDDLKRGFWIPSDASARDPSGWLANEDILRFFKALRSRQSLLISDSCFSGSLIPSDGGRWLSSTGPVPPGGRAAVIMSSGGDEPVSDEGFDGHSIFAFYLIQSLGESLLGETTGSRSFEFIRSNVRKHHPQTPRYGAIPAAGHTPGVDFVFRRNGSF
jgi:hypothetical protein